MAISYLIQFVERKNDEKQAVKVDENGQDLWELLSTAGLWNENIFQGSDC
jgi:hypothetical protein